MKQLFIMLMAIGAISFCAARPLIHALELKGWVHSDPPETKSNGPTTLNAFVDILQDTVNLCLRDSALIEVVSSTNGDGITWSPMDSLNLLDPEHGFVKPSVSTWYYVTLQVDTCIVVDSVFIRVDSLPQNTAIEAIPARAMYCEGETISLVSPNYQQALFPDIRFKWTPGIGLIYEDTLYNQAISATATTKYYRKISNEFCFKEDSIEIIVIPVATIEAMPENTQLCPGESVQLTVTADQTIDEWEWSPAIGLSCTNCTNPVATPPTTVTYQVKGVFMGCPSFDQVTVEVFSAPLYAFPDNTSICLGDSIILNTLVDPDASYQWLNPDGSLLSEEKQPLVIPTENTTYTLVISKGDCPPITDEVTVFVQEDFDLIVGDDLQICWDEAITLPASASIANVDFIWKDANGNVITDGILSPNDLSPGSSQTFFVKATDLPNMCFPDSGQIQVEVFPDFNLTVSPDQTINAGESVTLEASADLTGVIFKWTSNGMEVGSGSSLTVVPCDTTEYIVQALHPNDCDILFGSVTVNVLSSFAISDLEILQKDSSDAFYEGEEISFSVSTEPDPLTGITYEWYIDTVLIATTNGPSSGDFYLPELPEGVTELPATLKVIATNTDGCSEPLEKLITILKNPVVIPNVFTPNGDGKNDLFSTVSIVPVDIVGLHIWDRWGKMVYDNGDNSGAWDGMVSGKAAASDVYIYQLQYSIAGGERVYTKRGDVTLLR